MSGLTADLRFRGLVHQVTDPAVLDLLEAGGVTVCSGFDPSAASLHVGHLLQLCTLRRLQLAGNRPITLIGGGTGLIGDPGGKSSERPLLSRDDLAENVCGIRPQLEQFLDFTPAAGGAEARLLNNAEWLGSIGLVDFLRDVGKHFTVNQMVAKESVRARFDRPEHGISFTEFSYMLLQAYDFLRLYLDHQCTLQIGGSDQWGNIVLGAELVRKVCRAQVHGLTTPLVTKADGTKFGKTETGTVWLDPVRTSPYRLYQFFLNTDDAVAGTYLRYFTFLSHDEIVSLDEQTLNHPERRAAQRVLAAEVCRLVHGAEEEARAVEASSALFGEGAIASLDEATLGHVVDEAPSSTVPRQIFGDRSLDSTEARLGLVEALVSSGLAPSKSAARRAIVEGSVWVNDGRERDPDRVLGAGDLLHGRYLVLRRGRRNFHVLLAQ